MSLLGTDSSKILREKLFKIFLKIIIIHVLLIIN